MPVIQGEVSLAGAAVNDNVLSGSQFEYLPYDCSVEIGLAMESTGTVGDIVADIFSGSDVLGSNFKVYNTAPLKVNESVYFEDEALAGERLIIRLRNTTAATARKVQFFVRIDPL